VVRLHIHGRASLPATLDIPRVLSSRVDDSHAVVSVRDWTTGSEQALARRLGAKVEVEPLGLEEIFVELHR
jgi:hypothetical protein